MALSAAVIVAIALYFWEFRQPIINPDDPAQVALGQRIYAGYCASCHGKNLEGEPSWPERKSNGHLPASPLDASGHTSGHSDQQLFDLVKFGVLGVKPEDESDMPAFDGRLSETEVAAVLAFIKSTWPEGIRSHQEHLSK
jgi:mono/diheme cytochrome c family protein